MNFSELEGLLGGLASKLSSYPEEEKRVSTDIQGRPLDLSYSRQDFAPVDIPTNIPLGMNPSDLSYAMMPHQGAPESYVPTDFSGQEWRESPISLMGGGGSMQNSSVQGFNYGGRLGTEIPLDEKMRIALGVSGTSSDVTFGQGQPWGGRANRADITGIDATLRDLANNREYGAEVKKDFSGNPFVSLLFKQRF